MVRVITCFYFFLLCSDWSFFSIPWHFHSLLSSFPSSGNDSPLPFHPCVYNSNSLLQPAPCRFSLPSNFLLNFLSRTFCFVSTHIQYLSIFTALSLPYPTPDSCFSSQSLPSSSFLCPFLYILSSLLFLCLPLLTLSAHDPRLLSFITPSLLFLSLKYPDPLFFFALKRSRSMPPHLLCVHQSCCCPITSTEEVANFSWSLH